MEKVLAKFNELTDNKFDFLKLSSVNVNVRKCTCDFNFIYPADKETLLRSRKDYIEETLKKVIHSVAEVNINFKKSHFDFDFFKADFFAFLSAFPTLCSTLADKDVICTDSEDGTHTIKLILQQSVYDYCEAQNIYEKINDFLEASFCEKIGLELVSVGKAEGADEAEEQFVASVSASAYELERPEEGRFIRPQNVEDFIGRIIYEPASYIEDVTAPKESAVLCGTLGNIYVQNRKPKEGETSTDKKFFKFSLEDFTGKINCVYFPTKKTVDQFGLLKQGKQIVCRGKVEEDTYRGDGAKSYMVRDICLCTLPENFVPNRKKRRVPDKYTTVFPEKYVEKKQYSLFDAVTEVKKVPTYMLDKTFVVFDIETTGFNPDINKIIEIGAVKVENGKVTETFSTFIDPCEPLPERIVKLTHIEDSDVKGQPLIDDVLPDFYKFCNDTVLVGQNVQFDHGFITSYGNKMGIYFDNQLMDTLSLAKTYYPGLKNYKLGTLTKFFGVENKGAHRAIYDAWATMEVFTKLAEKIC